MRNSRSLLAPVLASILLGAMLTPAASVGASSMTSPTITLSSSIKIHPLLQYEAQIDPTQVVRVIVQQVQAPAPVGLLGGLLGGGTQNGDEQFTVIPALVTSVPVGSLQALAQSPNVRYISPDGPVQIIPGQSLTSGLLGGVVGGVLGVTSGLLGGSSGQPPVSGYFGRYRRSPQSNQLSTTYPFDVGAPTAWAARAGATDTGAGVTVAVLDTGVDLSHPDLSGSVIAVNVNKAASGVNDGFGHGTHVIGTIAGQDSAGHYIGVAPGSNVVSVKISDDNGGTTEADVLRGLQWVSQHRSTYNIKAINLSLSATVPQGYATSPIDAAVEFLWHQGITVVTSSGNLGAAEDAVWYAPGNDPLVITVGCLDDNQTIATGDDSLCPISSRGVTEDGFAKPELVAPGRKIASALAAGINGQPVVLAKTFPSRISGDGRHIRLSGTSMSTPMVTGAVALLLQRHPGLSPDQIKNVLVSSASGYSGQVDTAGELNVVAALTTSVPTSSPQILLPVGGSAPSAGQVTLLWDGNHWANSYWTSSHWDSSHWDSSHWDSAYWDSSHWDSAYWDSSHWDSSHWDSSHWDSGHWDSSHWDSSTYD